LLGVYFSNVACPDWGSECPEDSTETSTSATPSGTPSATPSVTPSATPSVTPSGTPSRTPSVTPSGTPAATPTSCPLNCTGSDLTMAQSYYNTRGEWAGVYTMNPNRAVKVNQTQCDINYTYYPVGAGSQGIDYRRFTYSDPTSCSKNVTAMGGYQSGTSAQ
jgi:hypothetical protein